MPSRRKQGSGIGRGAAGGRPGPVVARRRWQGRAGRLEDERTQNAATYDGSRSCMLELLMMLFKASATKRGGARSSDLYEGTRV